MTKARRLREMLTSTDTSILMEAHNGLSAKLVEEAGFEGIWGSGLSISAALGVRDSNEASWTQVLEVLEFMTDAVDIPMLLDGDTGYGNFNNMRRLVHKLEQRDVAGVCIEDKLFPKTNSFIGGNKQALADVDEFAGKIRAAKDTQRDADFMVVARTEAFIAGWGLQEALLRATAYAESGADVILVHSRRKDSNDVMSFMEHWTLDTPVIIVPTKYPTERIANFKKANIHNFIFANHSLRTVITSLQKNLKTLRETEDLMSLEDKIVPVTEIFRLQNVSELQESEGRYLPKQAEPARALVLAATKGNFGDLVKDKPKCMLNLKGKPVLTWHTEAFNSQGIKTIGVVRGYKKEAVNINGLHYFDNDEYETTGELFSLYQATDFIKGSMLLAYGDVIYDQSILRSILDSDAPMTVGVDAAFKLRQRDDSSRDLVGTTGISSPLQAGSRPVLTAVGSKVKADSATGEWIGLLALTGEGAKTVVSLLERLAKENMELLRTGTLIDLLAMLIEEKQEIRAVHTYGHWRDLDEDADLLESDHVS